MEYNQELVDKEWQSIFDREEYYLSLLESKEIALYAEMPIDERGSIYWNKKLELFELETKIQATKHYIESARNDKAQQDAYREAVKKAIDENRTAIMAKARRCIDNNTDRKSVLEALMKDIPTEGTPEYYKRMQAINEHTNVAQMPKTSEIQVVKDMPKLHAR